MKIPTKIDCGSIWATDEVRGSFFSSAVCRSIYNYAFCKRFPHLFISLSKRVGWCLQVKWFFGEWPFFIAETGRWLKCKLIFQSVHLIHFQKVPQCIFMGGPASPKISVKFLKNALFLSQVIDLRNWSRSFSVHKELCLIKVFDFYVKAPDTATLSKATWQNCACKSRNEMSDVEQLTRSSTNCTSI